MIQIRKAVGILVLTILAGALSCAGRNVHKGANDRPEVMVRKWTLSTRSNVAEMGDRGTEYSNPVVRDNTLVFGNRSIGLISVYPGIQQQRWVLPVPKGVISELTLDKNSVYFGGGDGFLYSVSLETGHVNWRYELRNPHISRPTLAGGRLLATTSDDTVVAVDASTGKWLWQYKRKTQAAATIQGASSPKVDGQQVLAGMSDGFLVALQLEDGQLRWERRIHSGAKFTDVDASPVIEGDAMFVPSYDGALYALRRTTGDILWRFDAGGSKSALIENGKLYLPSSDGHVYALEISSGKQLWKFDLDEGVPTQIVNTGRYLVFGSSHQYLYAIERETGALAYRYNVGWGSGFAGAPAYDAATKRLYILSSGGNLYSFLVRGPESIRTRKLGQTDPYRF